MLGHETDRVLRVATLLAWGIWSLAPCARAQDGTSLTLLNEYKVQPEVWHFTGPEEPGVDAQGDLTLSVPLMKVPGRGLSFDVSLSYRSSIRVDQEASWIGTGWNFDPGSVTREPEGGMIPFLSRFVHAESAYGVDAFDADFFDFSVLPRAQPDVYYIHLPGRGTFEATQSNIPDFPLETVPGFGGGSFIVNDHQPWQIEATMSAAPLAIGGRKAGYGMDPVLIYPFTQKPDFVRFVVTTEDGTRYVFARPTLSQYDVIRRLRGGPAELHRQHYVSTWRLVAILGADYTKAIPDDLDPEWPQTAWPADTDEGNWIRFEYDAPHTALVDVNPLFRDTDAFVQRRYLKAVVTPTHRADFLTQRRYGPTQRSALADTLVYQRLTVIRLTSRLSGKIVEEVRLDQDNLLNPKGQGFNDLTGRLRLTGIRFFGRNAQPRPGYRFAYYEDPATGDDPGSSSQLHIRDRYGEHCTDDFGFLTDWCADRGGARAWSLKQVWYPSGGWDVIDYEEDTITRREVPFSRFYSCDNVPPPSPPCSPDDSDHYMRQDDTYWADSLYVRGGARVTRVLRNDGAGNEVVTAYAYQGGALSGVPMRAWQRMAGASVRINVPPNRGKVGVYYSVVDKVMPGNGRISTRYTTSYSLGAAQPVRAIFVHQPTGTGLTDIAVMQSNQDWNWGIAYRIDTFAEADGVPVRTIVIESNFTPTNLRVAWVWPAEGLGVHFVRSRKLSEVEVEPDGGGQQREVRHTSYGYDDATNLVREVRQRYFQVGSPAARWKVTSRTFAYEKYDTLKSRNILSPVVAEELWDGTDERNRALGQYYASTVTPWGATSHGFYKPRGVYRWRSAGSSTSKPSLSFTDWNAPVMGSCSVSGAGAWQRDSYFKQYDVHGNPTILWNAHCAKTTLSYNASYKHAYLTKARVEDLAVTLSYDPTLLQMVSITDETGRRTQYSYDAHGRLTAVRNAAGETVATHAYTFSDDGSGRFDPSAPHQIASTLYRSASESSTARQFFDGLGRLLQAHTSHPEGTVVAATDYDSRGRLWRAWKPYLAASGAYDVAYGSSATAYYDESRAPQDNERPYAETIYARDPLGRVRRAHPEGEGGYGALSSYGVGSLGNAHFAYVETTGERGTRSRAYTDALGREVRRRAYEHQTSTGATWSVAANARYDGPNPLPPNDAVTIQLATSDVVAWSCTFNVSGEGQAVLRVKDPHGTTITARTGSDGREACGGSFFAEAGVPYVLSVETSAPLPGSAASLHAVAVRRVHTYGRVVETGFDYDALGNLMRVQPPNTYAPPVGSTAADWETTYAYNSLGQLLRKDTPDDTAPHLYAYDAVGNLRKYRDPNRAGGGFIYSDYDIYNRLLQTGLCPSGSVDTGALVPRGPSCPGSPQEVVAYTYDTATPDRLPEADLDVDDDGTPDYAIERAKGHLTQVTFAGGFELFSYDPEGRVAWYYVALDGLGGKLIDYAYDLQGNVMRMRYQPGQPDAFTLRYTYDAAGRLAQVISQVADEAEVVEAWYAYTAAGQVRSLRMGPDQTNIPAFDYRYQIRGWLTGINAPVPNATGPFSLGLTYQPDGNVAMMEWATRDNEGGLPVRYTYSYDSFARLTGAQFARRTGGVWQAATTYSVGPITYDDNGNITSLVRQTLDAGGNPMSFSLGYHYAGSNRLGSVSGSLDQTYDYDANGNVVTGRGVGGIQYDRRNLPTSLTSSDGRTQSYRYDAAGRRVVKGQDGAGDTFYVRTPGGEVLAVYTGGVLRYWNILAGATVMGRVEATTD